MAIKLILRYLILCCIAAGFFACSTIRNSNKMKEPTVQIETTDGNIVVKTLQRDTSASRQFYETCQ